MKKIKLVLAAILGLATVTTGLGGKARADTIVSVGYYDLGRNAANPACCGNNNAVPDPWLGSPNTAFDGDAGVANAGDPDESGILLHNSGPVAVTLAQGANITFGGNTYTPWDSFIGAGGQTIPSDGNVILSGTSGFGMDGSDRGISNAVIDFTLDGIAYSFTDTKSVLSGFPAFDETIPWTQIGCIGKCGAPTVPEPSTLLLLGSGLAGLGLVRRRFKG